MKLILYCILLLISYVIGSELDSENIQNSSEVSGIESEELKIDNENPELIKSNFIAAVKSADVDMCKSYAEKYDYLTEKFNRDIFSELIKCFETQEKTVLENVEFTSSSFLEPQDQDGKCWEIYEILKPSFLEVSHSTTTPVILSLRRNRMDLFSALLKLKGINKIIDKTDEFDRTALMYAAKRGSYFGVKTILNISIESVNFKDLLGKTAIHYACEMVPLDENSDNSAISSLYSSLTGEENINVSNKLTIVNMLMANNGMIFQDSPEYNLTFMDKDLREIISEFYGNVHVHGNNASVRSGRIISDSLKAMIVSVAMHFFGPKFLEIFLANPLFMYLNELCYNLMQVLFPKLDANLVFSIETVDGFKDISFNFLFIFVVVTAFNYISSDYFKKDGAKLF